jgi:hypothetical protein
MSRIRRTTTTELRLAVSRVREWHDAPTNRLLGACTDDASCCLRAIAASGGSSGRSDRGSLELPEDSVPRSELSSRGHQGQGQRNGNRRSKTKSSDNPHWPRVASQNRARRLPPSSRVAVLLCRLTFYNDGHTKFGRPRRIGIRSVEYFLPGRLRNAEIQSARVPQDFTGSVIGTPTDRFRLCCIHQLNPQPKAEIASFESRSVTGAVAPKPSRFSRCVESKAQVLFRAAAKSANPRSRRGPGC